MQVMLDVRILNSGLARRAAAAMSRPAVRAVCKAAQERVAVRTSAATSATGSAGGSSRSVRIATMPLVHPGSTSLSTLERMIQSTFNSSQPGARLDWQELEGCWVLEPPAGVKIEAVVHFLGGAFVSAAPQLSYRLFLEALSSRGVLVVATPYSTAFDQLKTVEEIHTSYVACMAALHTRGIKEYLPVYGVGHSLGALMQALLSTRYSVKRAGNVLISFNNKPATETIPFLLPLIAPGARLLGPLLIELAQSPISSNFASTLEAAKVMLPSLLRQLLPLVEQLTPIYLDVAQGRQEFTPSPEAAKGMFKDSYGVRRNLLLRFKDDSLDETSKLNALLLEAYGGSLDIDMRTLAGGHIRPLQQAIVDLPPPLAMAANQAMAASGELLQGIADTASDMGATPVEQRLHEIGRSISSMAWVLGGQVGGPVTDNVQGLADEVAAWMGVGTVVIKGTRALPAELVVQQE